GSGERGGAALAAPGGGAAPGADWDGCCAAAVAAMLPASRNASTAFDFITPLLTPRALIRPLPSLANPRGCLGKAGKCSESSQRGAAAAQASSRRRYSPCISDRVA